MTQQLSLSQSDRAPGVSDATVLSSAYRSYASGLLVVVHVAARTLREDLKAKETLEMPKERSDPHFR